MRYFDLQISDPVTGQVYVPNAKGNGFNKQTGGTTFTSYANGVTKPGALNIEFQIPAAPFDKPRGQTAITIWGIGLGMIGQASDFNANPAIGRLGADIVLRAGFKKGLPLANPAQAGIVLLARVFQAYGNWQGVNQTLEFIVNPAAAHPDQDISFHWPAGTELASAIFVTLQQAFLPKYGMMANINIASLTQANDEDGTYDSLSSFAAYIAERSQTLGAATYGSEYSGVLITITGNTILAYDSENPRKTTQLKFQDLIGQPTWILPNTVNFKTALRSDIASGDQVMFPSQIVAPYALTSAAAAAPNVPGRSKSVFQGPFRITEVNHFANFRAPDADSWNSSFNAVPIPNPSP